MCHCVMGGGGRTGTCSADSSTVVNDCSDPEVAASNGHAVKLTRMFFACVNAVTELVVDSGLLQLGDADLVHAWLSDLTDLGYTIPDE